MKYILASKSPRRKELLGELIDNFEIITKEVDESLPGNIHPREGVEILAVRKGEAVASELENNCMVISSDTLVELGGVPLGKPADRADAISMLRMLSGKAHNVHTGVAVHFGGKCYSGVATTAVYFRDMTDAEIEEYVDSGDPMDKAGSYGIQSGGGKFVEKIEGDYDTVVGLSVALTKRLINEAIND
ncbi:MAG: septum formation protein Maf [Clostridia bacterium]|nr:septum formation protein Maf [Clostridia bacterium]